MPIEEGQELVTAMQTGWFDVLACSPAIGFKLSTKLQGSEEVRSALASELAEFVDVNGQGVTLTAVGFNTTIDTTAGFTFGVEPSRLYVEFQPRFKFRVTSGKMPEPERVSLDEPYTELLGRLGTKIVDVTLKLREKTNSTVSRVGVVVTTMVEEEFLPPGITDFIDYLGAPFSLGAEGVGAQISAVIAKRDETTDRCAYTITKPDDGSSYVTVKLDWSRTFDVPQDINKKSLISLIDLATTEALTYFNEIGEGLDRAHRS